MPESKSVIKKPRIDELDIAKAIAIILMVMDHSGVSFRTFFWRFHMAVFFIASGFFYKESSSESIQSVSGFVFNKFRRNWIPFFVWNAVFVLLHNVLANTNIIPPGAIVSSIPAPEIYSVREIMIRIVKGALFSYKEPLIGGFWFFKILFLISCSYCIVDYLLRKIPFSKHQNRIVVQLVISVLFLAFGHACSKQHIDLHGLEYIGSYYCLYYFGIVFHNAYDRYKGFRWYIWIIILLVAFGILCWLYPRGRIGYNRNDYTSPQYLLACAISGWIMVYSASVLLNKIPVIRNLLISIGKRTVFVLILHIPVLKIVEIAEAYLYGNPVINLTTGANLRGGAILVVLYTIIGVGVPVILGIIYQKIKIIFLRKAVHLKT